MTSRWIRVLPHINDTVLLSAAVGLVLMSGQYPFVDAWLTAKVLGLTAYIILGSLALRTETHGPKPSSPTGGCWVVLQRVVRVHHDSPTA